MTHPTDIRDATSSDEPSLPTTFVSAAQAAQLTQMLELHVEQAQQIAGGLASSIRCCRCHCCSCH